MQYKNCFGPKSLNFNLKDEILYYLGRIQGYYKKGWNQNLFDPAFYIISNTYALATYLATAMCHGS